MQLARTHPALATLGPAAALLVQLENSLSMGLVNVLTVVLGGMGLGQACPRV